MLRYCLIALLATAPLAPAMAQSPASTETLADLKQDLSGLLGSVQGLKRELSTTGASGGADLSGTSALARIDAMEAELQRLTSLAEELQFRINRVVEDGTNRIGDLQFLPLGGDDFLAGQAHRKQLLIAARLGLRVGLPGFCLAQSRFRTLECRLL